MVRNCEAEGRSTPESCSEDPTWLVQETAVDGALSYAIGKFEEIGGL